jgi:hypothetical protein
MPRASNTGIASQDRVRLSAPPLGDWKSAIGWTSRR